MLFAADRLGSGSLTGGAAWAVPVWRAVGVETIAAIVLYIVEPEVLFGAVAFRAYVRVRDRRWSARVAAAALVSLVYLGALAAASLVVEGG